MTIKIVTSQVVAEWAFSMKKPITSSSIRRKYKVSRERAIHFINYIRAASKYTTEVRDRGTGYPGGRYEITVLKIHGYEPPQKKGSTRVKARVKPEYSPLMRLALGLPPQKEEL